MISRKSYPCVIAAILFVGATILTACTPQSKEDSQDKKSIVVASYPEYDWLCQIIGKDSQPFTVKLLMDGGIDLHSYEPNIQDIAAINKADLFIYNGGSSYNWVKRVLNMEGQNQVKSINLMEQLSKQRRLIEGEPCNHGHNETCEHEHHNCEHEHCDHHEHCGHEHEQVHEDEHIWLSLRHAIILCSVIEEALAELTPEQSEQLEANKQAYIAQLQALDARYTQTVQQAKRDSLIIADRFPFIYLFSDYGLKHHAAFQGCSSETEASFATVSQLSETAKQLQPKVILTVKGGMKKLAQTIISNSGQSNCQIMELNDLHTRSCSSYLDIMEENRQVLEAALAP